MVYRVFLLAIATVVGVVQSKGGLRSAFKTGQPTESVKFAPPESALLEVARKSSASSKTRTAVTREDAVADVDFGYAQANDPKKETARSSPGSGIGADERQHHTQQQFQPQMRFARQRATMFPQQFQQPYAQQFSRMQSPGYGHAFQNFGPMGGGPLSPNSGMGSFPASVDPRGFGMMGNTSQPWDIGMNPGFMPSFGTQMVPGMPFPTQLQGYGVANAGGMGMPPFTGRKFSALGPYGPFNMEDDADEKGQSAQRNVTLMGPRPFGPFGVQPQMPQGNMMMGPYGGPMMGGMMGGMPTMGGLSPRYDPRVVMHHMAMMGGGEQTFNTPGLIHGAGSGYPHPDFDRYHSVLYAPVPPEGGEAAKKA